MASDGVSEPKQMARDPGGVRGAALRDSGDGGSGTVTVVLADDHALVRSAVRMVLEAEPDLEVVAEAGDLHTAVRKVLGYKPSVAVLDLNMPDGSALQAIPRFRDASPGTAIVLLTMDHDPLIARAAMRGGASAFVPKEAADSELVAATRAAGHGRAYLDPELGGQIVLQAEQKAGAPDGLSGRELEVLQLIALGHTNPEISDELGLSVRTVEAYRSRIQQKTHEKSRSQMVGYARDHGLI